MNRFRLFFFLILLVGAGLNIVGATGFAFAPLQKKQNQPQENGDLTATQLAAVKQLEEKRFTSR